MFLGPGKVAINKTKEVLALIPSIPSVYSMGRENRGKKRQIVKIS